MKTRRAAVTFKGPEYFQVVDEEFQVHYLKRVQILPTLFHDLHEHAIVILEYFGDAGQGDWNLVEIVDY